MNAERIKAIKPIVMALGTFYTVAGANEVAHLSPVTSLAIGGGLLVLGAKL